MKSIRRPGHPYSQSSSTTPAQPEPSAPPHKNWAVRYKEAYWRESYAYSAVMAGFCTLFCVGYAAVAPFVFGPPAYLPAAGFGLAAIPCALWTRRNTRRYFRYLKDHPRDP